MNKLNHFVGNYTRYFVLISIFMIAISFSGVAETPEYYQIQVYRLNGKAQEGKVDNFLKNAYLPALHRAGVKKVGVFKPLEKDTLNGKRVYIWMTLKSMKRLMNIQQKLAEDEEYQTKGKDFLGAPFNNVPFLRKESILLKAFPEAPKHIIPVFKTSPSERIYELRSYEAPTENLFRAKVKMFNEGGEIQLFNSLKFNTVFSAEVISGSTMPNLMYLTAYSDMAEHDARWKTFGSHPEWKKLSSMPEYLNTVSKAVILLMHPTDYSDF